MNQKNNKHNDPIHKLKSIDPKKYIFLLFFSKEEYEIPYILKQDDVFKGFCFLGNFYERYRFPSNKKAQK